MGSRILSGSSLLGQQTLLVDSQGNGDYTTIQAALNAAAVYATTTSRWSVRVAPGLYTEQITLKNYVDLTLTLTPTQDPSVYRPNAIGDSRNLDSFIISMVQKPSGSGSQSLNQCDLEFARQPLAIHAKTVSTGNGYNQTEDVYQVGDWVYASGTGAGFNIQPAGKDVSDLPSKADMRNNAGISYIQSASYVGQEDCKGIKVNHYTVDASNPTPELGNLKTIKPKATSIWRSTGII